MNQCIFSDRNVKFVRNVIHLNLENPSVKQSFGHAKQIYQPAKRLVGLDWIIQKGILDKWGDLITGGFG